MTTDERELCWAEFEPTTAAHVIPIDSLHLAKEGHKRFQIIEEVDSVRRLAP